MQGLPLHLLPNLLTAARLLLSLPIILLILGERFAPALWLCLVAGLTDALDGSLARRCGWVSRLGALLDPLADKLLLVGSSLALAWVGVLPWWLCLMMIGRDLLILGGAASFRLLVGSLDIRPTWSGKLCTVAQIVLVLALLLGEGLLPEFTLLHVPLLAVTAVLTLLSGADYVWRWSRYYRQARQGA